MAITAKLNYLRMSPRKVRLVADVIRGMDADEATMRLQHLPKHASGPMQKLLQSAIANAVHNAHKEQATLFIRSLTVDKGPTLKRFRARAFGRAADIHKHTSHITLVLGERARTARPKRFTAPKIIRKSPRGPEDRGDDATLEAMSGTTDKASTDLSMRHARRQETKGLKKTFTDIGKKFFRRKSV